MARPTLTGFDPEVTFDAVAVQAQPQLLDPVVSFTDAEGNFNGGTLTVSGLLPGDVISFRSGTTGVPEVSLSGSNIAYQGFGIVASFSGGAGATLTVTFSAAATSTVVEGVIRNLTFSTSDPSIATERRLTLNVTDAAGETLSTPAIIDVRVATNNAPTLSGFAPVLTVLETDGPQILDGDVTFDDLEGAFSGGVLTLSGLLAEDRGSLRNQGLGDGQIGLSGADVTYGGVIVGTLAGGSGTALTITFNAQATSTAVDAAIQNLTYANASDAPTAGRTLTLSVTDAEGRSTADARFAPMAAADNPFASTNFGLISSPSFVDLDGDGDLDAAIGGGTGVRAFINTATPGAAPTFVERTGADNPFNGIAFNRMALGFADLDHDGDLDFMFGSTQNGVLRGYVNTAPPLSEARYTGTFFVDGSSGLGNQSRPAFTDLDGDGDQELVLGLISGQLISYRTATIDAQGRPFFERTTGDGPFVGVDFGSLAAPTFVDLDQDGDLDMVVGEQSGQFLAFRNTAAPGAPAVFEGLNGADNPLGAFDAGGNSRAGFIDIDGDGDLDMFSGRQGLTGLLGLTNVSNAPARGTVNVTAENDAPVNTVPGDQSVTAGSDKTITGLSVADPDSGALTTRLSVDGGTLTVASVDGGATVTGSGTDSVLLSGTAAQINVTLSAEDGVVYRGDALNLSGADTLTVLTSDGALSDSDDVAITIAAVNTAPTLSGFAATSAYAEDAPAVRLDASVVAADLEGFEGGSLNVAIGNVVAGQDVLAVGAFDGITVDGTTVRFNGAPIGTITSDGVGRALTIALDTTAATATAVDALVQALTYRNASQAPDPTTRNLTVTLTDSGGATAVADQAISVTSVPDAPVLTGVAASLTVTENDAATPIDADVSFVDADFVGNGGPVSVSGVLAEDRVSIASNGDGAGEIRVDGADVFYEGLLIGAIDAADDGQGRQLTVNTNLNATDAAVEALIEAFTYANVSEDPTAARTLTIAVTDDAGFGETASRDVAVNVTSVNDAPAGADATVMTDEDIPYVFALEDFGFSDADGDSLLAVVIANLPAAGELRLGGAAVLADQAVSAADIAAGELSFVPAANASGAPYASFTFRVRDDGGAADGGVDTDPNADTLTIAVAAVNDTPTATPDTTDLLSFGTVTGNVLANDEDVEPGTLSVGAPGTYTGTYGTLTLATDGSYSYAADDAAEVRADDVVVDSFTYTAVDPAGAVDSSTLTVTITGRSTGTAAGDTIAGNGGDNRLFGLGGEDVLAGAGGADTLEGGGENDRLYGGAGIDTLDGGAGRDLLDGGAGGDRMRGGLGDDSYFVDDADDAADETGGGGYDTVAAEVDWAIGLGIERVIVRSAAGRTITGNAEANRIDGGAGDDTLLGGGGRDSLLGGGGADTLKGGSGDDTYYITDTGDVADESGGDGYDIALVTADWTIGAGIERALVRSGVGLTLTGNAEANRIDGGAGADTLRGEGGRDVLIGGGGDDTLEGGGDADRLDGGVGADTMRGGTGDDVYAIDDAGDLADETGGGGYDIAIVLADWTIGEGVERVLVQGAVGRRITGNGEANRIDGGAGADTLKGGAGGDLLVGGGGADALDGGAGTDSLYGGAGADRFVFFRGDGTDILRDYDADDVLALDTASFGLTGASSAPVQFGATATGPGPSFVYNEAIRTLYWDPDGAGGVAQERLAVFATATTLTADDFVLI